LEELLGRRKEKRREEKRREEKRREEKRREEKRREEKRREPSQILMASPDSLKDQVNRKGGYKDLFSLLDLNHISFFRHWQPYAQ
jgi:cobalamin-dependent methionine synthase I